MRYSVVTALELYLSIARTPWKVDVWDNRYVVRTPIVYDKVLSADFNDYKCVLCSTPAGVRLYYCLKSEGIAFECADHVGALYEAVMSYLKYGFYEGDPGFFRYKLRKHAKLPLRNPKRVDNFENPLLVHAFLCDSIHYDDFVYYRCYYDSELSICCYYAVDLKTKMYMCIDNGLMLETVSTLFNVNQKTYPDEIEALKEVYPSFYQTAKSMYDNGATLNDIAAHLLKGDN